MCFSSLVLSRRPTIFKQRLKSPQNPLTPIGSCRELHMKFTKYALYIPPELPINRPLKAAVVVLCCMHAHASA